MEARKRKIGLKNWFFIWSLGMVGQLCWNIENYWFNTFVYAKIEPNPTIITLMVAISATMTTIATFVFGTISDRIGKRKPFIGWGYILWGIFTIIFGLSEFASNNIVVAAIIVISADAIMSFFGSVGNDSGFNAWTTDLLNDENKGQIGATIAAHPVLATIIGTVVGGIIISMFGYLSFFVVMGLLVVVMGLFSLFFLNDVEELTPKKTYPSFIKQFLSIFEFKKLKENKELFFVLLTMAVFFIGFNVFFVHIGNYMLYNLGFDEGLAGLIQGGCLIISLLATIPAAILLNKGKNSIVVTIALISEFIGLWILYIFEGKSMPLLIIGVILVGIGYVLVTQTLTVWAKGLFPEENRAQFEGMRIVFMVLIPMIFGPIIADPLVNNFGILKIIEGKEGMVPTNINFAVASFIIILCFIPLLLARKNHLKEKE